MMSQQMFNEPKCQVVTPAQVHLFFHDFIKIAGGNHAQTALDEAIGFVWTRLMEQLELQREQGRIIYGGATNRLLSLQELKNIFIEFERYSKHPENSKTLEGLIGWIEMQVNSTFEQRQVKVK